MMAMMMMMMMMMMMIAMMMMMVMMLMMMMMMMTTTMATTMMMQMAIAMIIFPPQDPILGAGGMQVSSDVRGMPCVCNAFLKALSCFEECGPWQIMSMQNSGQPNLYKQNL